MASGRCLIRAGALTASIFAATVGSGGQVVQETPQKNNQASLVTVPPEVPTDAVRYSYLLSGNRAGVMAVWSTPDGARHNFFGYNDRGRGPSITTRVVVDHAGIPVEVDATGHDYFKGPVDEHFRLAK